MDVRSILARKGDRVEMIRPDALLLHAARLLRAHGVGVLVVSSDGRHVEGLLSERDVVVALAEHPELVTRRRVAEAMRRDTLTASPDDSVGHLMGEMTRHRQRQVPVVDHGELVGVVSVGDLLHHQLDDAALETRILRDVAIARS